MIHVRSSFHKVIYKRVRFSPKNNLEFLCWAKVSTFFFKTLIAFHNASFRKFENSQLSSVDSHKSGIIIIIIIIIKIKNIYLISFLMTTLTF
jgi:hypothetical protein